MVLTFARWERSLRFLMPAGFSQLLWRWTINLLQKRTFLFVANTHRTLLYEIQLLADEESFVSLGVRKPCFRYGCKSKAFALLQDPLFKGNV